MKFVEQFLEMMLAERGIAKNSLLSYKRDLEDFQEFLKQARLTEIEVKDSEAGVKTKAKRQLLSEDPESRIL